MKDLTIKELLQKTNSKQESVIKKLTVRELDEEGKGNYVSFVDDAQDTYDVNIKLQHENIETASCDCGKTKPCIHIIAVAKAINYPRAAKQPVKKTKKEPPEYALLKSVDEGALREWVKSLLEKNKDLVIAFTHHFSPRREYTPDELTSLTRQAVKSVVKNKKVIDQTMLKKIFELWTDIHEPALEQYRSNVSDENNYELIKVIVNESLHYKNYFDINTVKFDKYVDGILVANNNVIAAIENPETWKKTIGIITDNFLDDKKVFIPHYARQLFLLIDVSDSDRQIFIFEKLKDFALIHHKNSSYWYFEFIKTLFYKIMEHKIFEKYASLFFVAYGQNDYNQSLIIELIKIQKFDVAEKFCISCISNNYRDEYNIPYWILLKQIYTITNIQAGLVDMSRLLLPFTFNFEDYLLVAENTHPEEERKKFRTKIFTAARRSGNNMPYQRAEFCFRLLDHERKYLKMIELIPSDSTYRLIIRYFEPMFAVDKTGLLKSILDKQDSLSYYFHTEETEQQEAEDEAQVPVLLNLMKQKYDTFLLASAVKAKLKEKWSYQNKLVRLFEKGYQ